MEKFRIERKIENEPNDAIRESARKYIEFIQKINIEKNSLNKTFYIIIKENIKNNNLLISEEKIKENLTEKYLKIKDNINCR